MSTKVVRTRFFTRKGSGTFFVYRRFAVAECNDAMKAPMGLSSNRTVCEADGGASPRQVPAKALLGTVSRNEQRQGIIMAMVSCLLLCIPPILRVSDQSLRTSVHGRYARTQKKGKVLTYRGVLSAGSMVYSAQQIGV